MTYLTGHHTQRIYLLYPKRMYQNHIPGNPGPDEIPPIEDPRPDDPNRKPRQDNKVRMLI